MGEPALSFDIACSQLVASKSFHGSVFAWFQDPAGNSLGLTTPKAAAGESC